MKFLQRCPTSFCLAVTPLTRPTNALQALGKGGFGWDEVWQYLADGSSEDRAGYGQVLAMVLSLTMFIWLF